jgi:hypothetical protein
MNILESVFSEGKCPDHEPHHTLQSDFTFKVSIIYNMICLISFVIKNTFLKFGLSYSMSLSKNEVL